ncbi:hypothetical protein [Micromonospora sp. CA-246542]|uniref:hypothetical protein n=1 Tax=Micromonospora sp. CA-246542 TaxID=3239959 RepID=UPI003D8CA5AB
MTDPSRYPFVPRSNRNLRAGQYWALPLRNRRFACGRVMAVPAFGPRDRVGVVVGLMDWLGQEPPTSEQIAGRPVLEQAKSRFEAITNAGGEVLGIRPLDLDGLVADDPDTLHIGAVHRVWGWRTITNLAEEYFA